MTEPVTRDLVDRTELRRRLQANQSAYDTWSFHNANFLLDAMPSVECPRGWTRDEVLHELDTHPGAVCEVLSPFSGQYERYFPGGIKRWHPEVRRYDVRVVLPEPNPQLGDEEWTAPNLATECESARPTVTVDAANLRALLTYDGDNDFGAAGEMLRRELLDACSAVIAPEPVTVWVPWWESEGRVVVAGNGTRCRVDELRVMKGTPQGRGEGITSWGDLPLDESGRVEVLAEGDA